MTEKLARTNQSVEKAFAIIETLSAGEEQMRLTDVARAVQLPPSTAMRLLNTLGSMGYVSQSERTLLYSLSRKFTELCLRSEPRPDLEQCARPSMERLSLETGDCVCLSVERDGMVEYVDSVSPEGSDTLLRCQRLGRRAPLYCTAEGKFILTACYTTEALSRYMRRSAGQRFAPGTIVSINEMQMELNRCERHGYALDMEECELGMSGMAVGIRGYGGRVIGVISVVTPIERLSATRVHKLYTPVQDAAEEISIQMGFRGEFPRGEFNYLD